MYKREYRTSTCINSLEIRTPSQARCFHRNKKREIKTKQTKKAIPRNRYPKWNNGRTVRAITDPSQKERKNKLKSSELRHKQCENKTQPLLRKGLRKRYNFCRPDERKLTDQQCWSNGNGVEKKELEGFHALVHVNTVSII